MTAYEQHVLSQAAHFTAVRGRNPRERTRVQFATIEAAKAYAAGFGDGRTMIYAVTDGGRDAHICNA
jgi:hypothetical protein